MTGGRGLLVHAMLALGAALFLLPVWLVFCAATQDVGAINRGEIALLPRRDGLSIFGDVLFGSGPAGADRPVWPMLALSFAMALAIAAGKIVVSVLSAYAVAFFRFPLRMVCFWVIFATLMLPVEVRIIPTFEVVAGLGLINSFGGLVVPLLASATATLLFRQAFLAVPDELMEAARMDGAGPWRFLTDILIPTSAANIAALFVILFVYGWNQYLWPLLVATHPAQETIVVGIVKMIGTESATEWNRVMAAAMLALLPPVLVVLAMQRWFVKGLTDGEK
ncbi:sn-glycerol-3-phosphate ABC transporter permease UgpE [Aquabacter spiritensis]|uniref:sn-glycerol-3-phosphate transport system permease protein UgpE n=1 Tax=Aquabacter spiritensis TaxID=933073 RepID=A0A4R3LUY2_9HYPH|nr:sn-glycerol-3-phosphate ABC transporter permease UgpE [Aquabacter spiritensis]TCT04344.1 carbohydrate ABC transporter membrane protein 2 (CUT1 family) [Aquabacter spiritensis]